MHGKRILIGLMVAIALLAGCGAQPTAVQPTVAPTTAQSVATETVATSAPAEAVTSVAPKTAATSVATETVATSAPAETATEAATTEVATETAATSMPAETATSAATEIAAASDTAVAGDATPQVVAAANAFLQTLSDTEQESVLFDWTDTEQKQRWSNLPEGLYERAGLMWGNISEEQQNAWLQLMQTVLSGEGYTRVMAAWNADDVLAAEGSGGGGPGGQLLFGKQYYWIALIGTPSETEPWQMQWGGHHITINATIDGPNIALTPSFIGCQPCEYTDASGNTIRPLGDIVDEAFALVNSLDETQQQAAVLGDSSIDLVLGPGQDGKTIQAEGLPASELNDEQQAAMMQLIGHYTGLVNDEDAETRRAEVESTLDETYLAWYGPTEEGSAAYFRIAGPSIVIEYSPQSMGGNAANHIHGVYRDPSNEYGAKYTQ